MEIHRAKDRGISKTSWLTSYHSFSFNDWYDPTRTGFGKLRVLNDDVIAPGKGFGTHGHANMEIVTIPLSGAVRHEDSSGGSGVIKAGEVQRMSAGTGVYHSEFNASSAEPLHLLQIWIEPKQLNIPPSYEQAVFRLTKNKFTTIVDGTQSRKVGDALYIHQSVRFLLGNFVKGETMSLRGFLYAFLIEGSAKVDNEHMGAGDALALHDGMVRFEIMALSRVLVIEFQN